jgi:D-beta-D-heptose 7-phosphate kinase/D-beta-D-heptose 1-phosphate adenosyltransferase
MTLRHMELLCSIGRPRIFVIGDVILDRYLWGTVDRISPEGPIPILQVEREEQRPGGAANVAMNLVALGADAACASVIGNDIDGRFLVDVLEANGIDVSAVVIDSPRPTPIKTRCIGGSQQMIRIDRESAGAITLDTERELVDRIDDQVAMADLIIVSDYAKGSVTEAILAAAMSAAREHAKPVIVGPKGSDFSKYRGCSAVVPNLKELALATKMAVSTDVEVVTAAGTLLETIGCEFVVVTRGDDGMTLVRRERAPLHVRGRSRHVYDVTGAGDTALATLGLALASDISPDDAVHLANIAGGIAVTKVGVAAVERTELLDDIAEDRLRPGKICTVDELLSRLRQHRDQHETVVFTNGCFDMLHVGHLRTLRHAKAQGDILVVAINSDASARRLKGPQRPIVTQEERAEVLAALEDVDYVVIFEENTPSQLLECLRPNVLVKGGDYQLDEVVGADIMTAWAGRVSIAPDVEGISTTELVERIRTVRL